MDDILFLITKIAVTLFVIVLAPIYWKKYGFKNFFWLSDIGLFLTVFALWLTSPLLISIAAIAILPLEVAWNIDFFFQLITRRALLGVTDYMFDSNISVFVRSLSLFHVVVPIIWIFCLYFWGYNPHAFVYATLMIWIVLIATYFFTDPQKNINWVFFPFAHHWRWMPSLLWLIILLITFPTVILWPMHTVLKHILL